MLVIIVVGYRIVLLWIVCILLFGFVNVVFSVMCFGVLMFGRFLSVMVFVLLWLSVSGSLLVISFVVLGLWFDDDVLLLFCVLLLVLLLFVLG